MYERLGQVTLKTGEAAEVGRVLGPDPVWGPKLMYLLGHKGQPWAWQIAQSLERDDLGFASHFYVLSKGGTPFANICTFEAEGVGTLGHVYTSTQERRKGAADLLMRALMDDFRARGGRALYLGTEYDTPPYHLYARHGFVGREEGSGYMFYFEGSRQAFETAHFAAGPARIEPIAFKHWPVLPALTMMEHPCQLRAPGMRLVGPKSSEGPVLFLLKEIAEGGQSVAGAVAVSEATGATAGFAVRNPDHYFGGQVDILDVFTAPGFEKDIAAMVDAVGHVEGRKMICYSDRRCEAKDEALKALGFTVEGSLKKHLRAPWGGMDVEVWSKFV